MTARPGRTWIRGEIEVAAADVPPDEAAGQCAAALTAAGLLGLELPPDAAPRETLRVVAYFPAGASRADVERLLAGSGRAAKLVAWTTLADGGWVEAWNRTLQPVDVGRRFTILPGGGEPPPGRLALRVVPGRAFGTGHHESTRLALEWLEDVVAPGARVLDVGTGTGILAAAALELGAARVLATDLDPEAIEVAAENLSARGGVELLEGAGTCGLRGPFDVVAANVTADVLVPMLPELRAVTRASGAIVLAGLLGADEPAIESAAAPLALRCAWRRAGEWSAAALT